MIGPSETRWRDELVINSYADYPAVERAVDLLSDRGFPVQTVRVVGRDVRIVEQITGRLTPWRAAGAGALSGMWFGAMIGLVLGLVTPYVFAPLLWGVLLGAVFGAVSRASHSWPLEVGGTSPRRGEWSPGATS